MDSDKKKKDKQTTGEFLYGLIYFSVFLTLVGIAMLGVWALVTLLL